MSALPLSTPRSTPAASGAAASSNQTSAPAAASPTDRPIGELLRESLGLSAEQGRAISLHMRTHGLRFGDAAVALGLAQREDVLQALAQQFGYPYAVARLQQTAPELVTLHQPFSPAAEAIRSLRSQLLMQAPAPNTPDAMAGDAPKRLSLTLVSPNPGDGKSFLCANLAVALAQLGQSVVVVDADLRQARQHSLFGLGQTAGLSGLLAGRSQGEPLQTVVGLPLLSVLPAGACPPNPLELIERTAFTQLLRELSHRFMHVLIDTPALSRGSDAQVIAARCGTAVLLARHNASRLDELQALSTQLSHTGTRLAGVVLNTY
jgi:protein-tyrosine kinase